MITKWLHTCIRFPLYCYMLAVFSYQEPKLLLFCRKSETSWIGVSGNLNMAFQSAKTPKINCRKHDQHLKSYLTYIYTASFINKCQLKIQDICSYYSLPLKGGAMHSLSLTINFRNLKCDTFLYIDFKSLNLS